jgi:hypothetical protein
VRGSRLIAIFLSIGALALVGPGRVFAVNGGACNRPYDVSINPADFKSSTGMPNAIDNAYFPLIPGMTWRYEGFKEGADLVDVQTVTNDTKTIMGVPTRVVHDTNWEDGVLAEDTFDWYAQDDTGNIWYFGEDTREFDENGNVVTTEGSWVAGVHGNLPGLFMLAHPRSGLTYRQEFGVGVAVDMTTVLSLHRHLTVPFGTFGNVIETKEFSCIESGIDHKWYAPGIGNIKELAVAHGQEMIQLVEFSQ